MDEVQVFSNDKFGKVRIYKESDGIITFCGTDVAKALGYTNPQKALKDHCRKDGVTFRSVIDNIGRTQRAKFITEGNLYRLIAKSQLPEAVQFESWIFDEVLPTIRKTGGYVANDNLFVDTYLPFADDNTKLLFRSTLTVIRDQNEKLKALEPIKRKHDTFLSASNDQPMAAVAKSLGIGRNKLFEFLREHKVLRKNNEPYQKYLDAGLFNVIEKPIQMGDEINNKTQTYVTAKGVTYIEDLINKWKKLNYITDDKYKYNLRLIK